MTGNEFWESLYYINSSDFAKVAENIIHVGCRNIFRDVVDNKFAGGDFT